MIQVVGVAICALVAFIITKLLMWMCNWKRKSPCDGCKEECKGCPYNM